MMGASWALWAALLGVPLLPLSGAAQAGLAGAIYVTSHALFWTSMALAGAGATRWLRGLPWRWWPSER
jgi:hypothetical protein